MINKKEIVAMLLAGGQGSRLFALTQKQNQLYHMVENIRSLTSHCQTVQTQELTQSEF